ncbi:MAG: TldD/PmbA family protein, partial [Candidatus Binataceae bacterium]
MAENDLFGAIDFLRESGETLLNRFARAHPSLVYADLRFEAVFSRSSSASDGETRGSLESESASFGVSVWVAQRSGLIGRGQVGAEIGRLARSKSRLLSVLGRALDEAYERARLSARERAAIFKSCGSYARTLGIENVAPAPPIHDDVAAVFSRDPRTVEQHQVEHLARDSSAQISGLGRQIAFNTVAAMSELRDELFVSTEGSLIRQGCAFSQGDCYVVAQNGSGHQEIWDIIGQQRGFECLSDGYADELMPNPNLPTFAVALAREAIELAAAPVLKPPAKEVTVVTDPHFNGLLAHEIVGHPSEADRALKMEAAYAGRSWLLRSLEENELGRQIGSPLLSAFSDPKLSGYGHYLYDHEGMPGRRVSHIEAGNFRGFLNSRLTAPILGAEPNGSSRASAACHVPLIRMSNTFFAPGAASPERII